MKRSIESLSFLLLLVFSTFSLIVGVHLPTAKATFVEGWITQDTVWTLVDSPYIVSNDLVVRPNVTLTIEPDVEVQFGGNFSLIVEGMLVAVGTSDKAISFTSNKHVSSPGDWAAIKFRGAEFSTMTHCVVEYGTNGIMIENGHLSLLESSVGLSSQNGIVVDGGYVGAENNEIFNNTLSGIRVSGDNQLTMTNNTLRGNENGLILVGSSVSGLNIMQNRILSNRGGGIVFEAEAISSVSILNNVLSANKHGFEVLTNTPTYITRNYITDNTVGIYYQSGLNHEAHFNDILDNAEGMDATLGAAVNATYNYWGDRTGPKHTSMNPYGKGNSVGGDGTNIDFIFFLASPIDFENIRPTARLWADKNLVAPNQTVTLVGKDSFDDGRVDQYFFTFGDGGSSDWTTLSVLDHNYSMVGDYNVRLKVMDDFGVQSYNALTAIHVRNLTPLTVSVAVSKQTVYYNENVTISVYVSDSTNPIENAAVTLLPVGGGTPIPQTGLTSTTGYFTATFTAPDVTDITNVRIIARANKTGFADGAEHKYLKVLPPLTVQVESTPPIVRSEEASVLTVYATCGLEPVADASITLECSGGDLSSTTGITDLDGSFTTLFTAPQTMTSLNVTITAAASKVGYSGGEKQIIMVIEPKVLSIEISAVPMVSISQFKTNITTSVSYGISSIEEANVSIASNGGGSFSNTSKLTDHNGYATFTFTAPPVNTTTDISITARTTKLGYAEGQSVAVITINQGVMNATIDASAPAIASGQSATVNVTVTCNGTRMANAYVAISADFGSFAVINGTTDVNGRCSFAFTAPATTSEMSVNITANVTKDGFISASEDKTITINPMHPSDTGGGWSFLTVLLIIIPIVIVVVVVVLVKMKIIGFSFGEEEA